MNQTEKTTSSLPPDEMEKIKSPEPIVEAVSQETAPVQDSLPPPPLPLPQLPSQAQSQPSRTHSQSNTPSNSSSEPVVMHHVEGIQGNRIIVAQAQVSRPPILLDATIATLLILAGALLIKKFL